MNSHCNIVHLRIKKNAGLNELMQKYYMSQSVNEAEQSQMFSVFEGRSMRKMQTADELKMQDGDVIETRCGVCFKSQLCGYAFFHILTRERLERT